MLIEGQIVAISPPDYSDNFGNQYQNITISTTAGEIEGRKASKTALTEDDLNKQIEWNCEQAESKRGIYNKFTKPQDPRYASQNQQRGTQQPRQATKAPHYAPVDKKEPDWEAKDLRMARMNALTNTTKLICLMAEAHQDIDLKDKNREGLVNLVTQTADIIVHYIYNGKTKKQAPEAKPAYKTNLNYVGDDPPVPKDDDIPF